MKWEEKYQPRRYISGIQGDIHIILLSILAIRRMRRTQHKRENPSFVPGRELSEGLYRDVIAELMGDLAHSAALFGEGSDVIGLDSERSTDHGWGPRLQVFVSAEAVDDVRACIAEALPAAYRGWPTRFYRWQTGKIEHHIEVLTLESWLRTHFDFDPRTELTQARWLAAPQQLLLEVTRGLVIRDDQSELGLLQEQLSWYPHDVWLWLLASQWDLIAEKEALIRRASEVGDDLGGRVLAARLVHDLMFLWYLQAREYAPYAKWFGTVFSASAEPALQEALVASVAAQDGREREVALSQSYEYMAQRHNELAITKEIETGTAAYDVQIAGAKRPGKVINADRLVKACRGAIADSALRKLEPTGSIDQLTHRSDRLSRFTPWPHRLATEFNRLLSD